MIGWLRNLDEASRQAAINEASKISGIPAKALEKDWWVTLTLKIIFNIPYSRYFTFKGGTSLSKGWKIINRFSEDIDISLNPEAFGMKYIKKPSKTYVELLRRKACAFTTNEIAAALKFEFQQIQVPSHLYSIEVEMVPKQMPDMDPQTIYVNYISVFDPNPYLPDRVKIEFSVRSLQETNSNCNIHSLLFSHFPSDIYHEESYNIITIQPQQTLIEKILLLHEEYNRLEEEKMRTNRMSRHYYDIFQLSKHDLIKTILNDDTYIEKIIEHRQYYSKIKRFDYATLKQGSLQIFPSQSILALLRKDYEIMSSEMIYGELVTFDEIINDVQKFLGLINKVY